MEIKFYDCNQENLEKVYSEYVSKVTENKDYTICTNIICLVKYTKPKVTGRPDEFIQTDYKLMTTPMLICYCDGQNYSHKTPFISFWTKNIDIKNVLKFAKVEDIEWDKLIKE